MGEDRQVAAGGVLRNARKVLGRLRVPAFPAQRGAQPTRNVPANWFVRRDYSSRDQASYFEDVDPHGGGIVYQPDVYPLAAHLARRFGCERIIDVGCGTAGKLVPLHPEFGIVGIDIGANIEYCRANFSFGRWISHDLEGGKPLQIDDATVAGSLVVCADVVEHLIDPSGLLGVLSDLLESAPVALVSTPERDLARGRYDAGPPANPAHVREWNLDEFRHLLHWGGMRDTFIGLTMNQSQALAKRTILAMAQSADCAVHKAPPNYEVLAVMPAYNEADIIMQTLDHLLSQGIRVHLVDNWSTDATVERAELLAASGPLVIERFPQTGPQDHAHWRELLAHIEHISSASGADWAIHHDADEVRLSPWPQLPLRDGLYRASWEGFNAVDFTVLNFRPVDERWEEGHGGLSEVFGHFEFGTRPGHTLQIKAWRPPQKPVNLVDSGGHSVSFEGRRVYPFNFVTKHYPVRSSFHGRRKVGPERLSRWSAQERASGWHSQYDAWSEARVFQWRAEDLLDFDQDIFWTEYLTERIGRVGLERFSEAPLPGGQTY